MVRDMKSIGTRDDYGSVRVKSEMGRVRAKGMERFIDMLTYGGIKCWYIKLKMTWLRQD